MFHLHATGMNDGEALFLYYNFKASAIRPWRQPAQRRFEELSRSAPAGTPCSEWHAVNGIKRLGDGARPTRPPPDRSIMHLHRNAPASKCALRRNLRENILGLSRGQRIAPRRVAARPLPSPA
jgi:hypothetical protein